MQNYRPYYHSSYALVIGINAYRHAPQLAYATNDADAVGAALIGKLGFPAGNVILLKDDEATKNSILDRFLKFRDTANNPDDCLFVFFAGHGTTVDGVRGPIGYLVPVDGDKTNLNTLIRWDDLTRNAELIPAKHILFIVDACYSGLALQRALPPGTRRFISDMLQRYSRQVIAAGKADETVADGGGPEGHNSIFTGHLVDGLNGAAQDANGIVTANELMAYVYQKVSQDSHSRQTPHYGHLEGDGDFVLITPNDEHNKPTQAMDYLVESTTEVPEPIPLGAAVVSKPNFAARSGYADPSHANFGRNIWTDRLDERRQGEIAHAFSWMSIVLEPVSNEAINIDIAQQARTLAKYEPRVGKPYERFIPPKFVMTTIDSVVMHEAIRYESDRWKRFLRIEKTGNMEFATTTVVGQRNEVRFFQYVKLIGSFWQFLFFAKDLLVASKQTGGTRILTNFVGTRDTILADFSREPGKDDKRWLTPFESDMFGQQGPLNLKCPDPNLQVEYQLMLSNLGETESTRLITDLCEKLGLAYNHNSTPRCFNFETAIFPWTQYLNEAD